MRRTKADVTELVSIYDTFPIPLMRLSDPLDRVYGARLRRLKLPNDVKDDLLGADTGGVVNFNRYAPGDVGGYQAIPYARVPGAFRKSGC